jgi:hypothetical protein
VWTTRCCAKEIRGTKPEHCPDCHETFANTLAGDKHNYGPWVRRKCRNARQMRKAGLEQNAYGYWTLAKNLKRDFPLNE